LAARTIQGRRDDWIAAALVSVDPNGIPMELAELPPESLHRQAMERRRQFAGSARGVTDDRRPGAVFNGFRRRARA
jgi:hypothetical protein